MTAQLALVFVVGVVVGLAVGWWAVRRQSRELVERALPQVADSVLQAKTQQLRESAAQELKLLGNDTVGKVSESQARLQEQVKSLKEQLDAYQTRITGFEESRAAADARLQQQVALLSGAGDVMKRETEALRQALSSNSAVRGNWGETVLQNILTQCGLSEHVDFDRQVSVEGGRPDVVVRLPSGNQLALDAKASLADFLAGVQAATEADRQARYRDFARVLRDRAKALASRDYSRNLDKSLPFVVMFVPGEGAFRAALDADPELCEYGRGLTPRIMITSPSTLFPLLVVIANDWQQHAAARNAGELLKEFDDLGKRLIKFVEYFQTVGEHVDSAGKAFNQALASFRSRLVPSLDRIKALHDGWVDPALPEPVENLPQLKAAAAPGLPPES